MREPVFNETVQLGIVVRDLEATVRRYVDDYGIGPWEFAQIDAGDANNYRESTLSRSSAPRASPSPRSAG
jgi:methylmalonyl-CoA/ethylmalonyl-CoA epimerase